MGLQVGLVGEFIALIAWALLDEVQGAPDTTVKVGLCQLATLHTSHNRVELFILARLQHVVASPHLDGTILATKPVGHDSSLVAPFIAEDSLDKVLALGGVGAVDVVVGSHHSPGLALLDGNLEALQVDFTEGPL